MCKLTLSINLMAIVLASPAHAYIGPGMGAGTIAVVLGVIASIFLAFVAILWYPLKRLVKGRKRPAKKISNSDTDSK